jgi:hypothetical protein
MNLTKAVCLLATVLIGLNVAAQQITGSIRGTVADATGAVVQGATVTAKQTDTGLTRTATTDRVGNYILLELPVGHYQLRVEAKSFQKYVQEGISLNVNETATVPVRLVVGSENQQVQAPEITGFSANRPNLVAGQNPKAGPHKVGEWLNTNAFSRVIPDPNSPVQQFGSAGRNIASGPRYSNWDFAIAKDIPVAESKEFQFRAEFFNVLNHANFHLPNSDISSPTFNDILAAEPPRLVQFALKFLY